MRRLMSAGFTVLIIWYLAGITPQNGNLTTVAVAQLLTIEPPPLLVSAGPWLWNDGDPDLWWWNGESAEVFEGCAGDVLESVMVLSPNQRLVAYLSTADLWIEKLNQGWEGSGANFPNDVLVCNLDTGEITHIANQPENASTEDGEWYFASRSQPAWSPDGNQLAWSEYTVGAETTQLMMHDLTTAETSVLVEDLNPQNFADLVQIVRVSWSEAGIGVENFAGFEVYDGAGELLNTFPLPQYNAFEFWITYQDKVYIAYHDDTWLWHLLDPLTGEDQLMPGLPEMYSVDAPDGLALRFDIHVDPPPNSITPPFIQPRWAVVDDETVMLLDYDEKPSKSRIALSPDGQSFAYIYEDRLWQWQAGEGSIAAGMEDFVLDTPFVSLAWTPFAWRVGAPAE